MIKIIKYFFQSIFIYIFFLIGRILGLKISRIFFSKVFSTIGPLFKSKNVIDKNLEIFSKNLLYTEKKRLLKICGKTME